MTTPITSSAAEVTALQQELGDIAAARSAAYAGGAGPTYSIGGPNGSESVDVVGYLRYLHDREQWILQKLQDLQPFLEVQSLRVGGSILGR
jgi:hypothetical protein